MRTPDSERVAKRLANLFNFLQFSQAVNNIRENALPSSCFLAVELTYSSTHLSNYRYLVKCTDGSHQVVLSRFDTPSELMHFCHLHNVVLGFDIHKLVLI